MEIHSTYYIYYNMECKLTLWTCLGLRGVTLKDYGTLNLRVLSTNYILYVLFTSLIGNGNRQSSAV